MRKYPEILRVDVNSMDIDSGARRSPSSCPIAKAIRRMYPDADFISVGSYTAIIDKTPYKVPMDARNFITRYDNSQLVDPAQFELERD